MNPFTTHKEKSVASLGECQIIQEIRNWLGNTNPPSPMGIGDDCALLEVSYGTKQVITVDPVIYGVHFDDSVSPEDVGAKLLNRNASDVAAMGCSPTSAILSLTLPSETRIDWLQRFYQGLSQSALVLEMQIIGGDLASAPDQHLAATLCMLGSLPTGASPLLRKGADVDDVLFVTGELGGSIHQKHYRFTPRVKEGLWLAKNGYTSSCLDVSDGIGKDAPQLLKSSQQAIEIDALTLPLSQDAVKSSKTSSKSPQYHALNDGEDFELLFTVPKERAQDFIKKWAAEIDTPLTCIGKVITRADLKSPSLHIINAPNDALPHGYEHLR